MPTPVRSGFGGGHKPYMIYELEKQKNAILVHLTTKGLRAAPVGSFALDKITEDFVQTVATKFFTLVTSEITSPPRKDVELV